MSRNSDPEVLHYNGIAWGDDRVAAANWELSSMQTGADRSLQLPAAVGEQLRLGLGGHASGRPVSSPDWPFRVTEQPS